MKVYIVEGQTGEYSDIRSWPVRGYMNQAAAMKARQELQTRANEIGARWDELKYDHDEASAAEKQKLLEYLGDPQFDRDYDDTSYSLYEVDIVDLGWPERPEG